MELDRPTQEINLIVTAPYVVSLKGLYDIVCKGNVSHIAIKAWATAKPCQINAIALILLDGLQEGPFTFVILTAFFETFRNAILRIRPIVLDELLQKCLETPDPRENGRESGKEIQDRHFAACVAMLSTPLPSTTIAPQRLSNFISALIDRIVQQPCVETIRPLHHVMAGISASFLDWVPEATFSRFQTECTRVLRNMDDHLGSLLCLATFAKLASSGASSTLVGSEWFKAVGQFFDQTRGVKTMDLAVLRAILSCSTSSNLSTDERIQCIRLAREICDAVKPDQKEIWISNNRPKIVKLCEKILKSDLDDEIRMTGLIFLAALLTPSMLPNEIVQLAHGKLVEKDGWGCFANMPEKEIAFLTGRVAQRFNQKELSAVLDVLALVIPGKKESCMAHFMKGIVTHSIVCGLMTATKEYPSMKTALFAALFDSLPSKWWNEGSLSNPRCDHGDCSTSELCPGATAALRNKIILNLALLAIEVLDLPTLSATTESQRSRIMDYLATQLAGSKDLLTCAGDKSTPTQPPHTHFSIFNSVQISRRPINSRNWREEVARTLAGHAEQTHDIIIRHMGEICRDLEARCNTVEEPLRSLTADFDALKAKYEACKADRDSLASRAEDMKATISTLEDENEQLERRVESADAHAEDLSSRLRLAQDDLKNNELAGRKAINRAEEKARDAELKYLATITAKDDTIDEQQDEIDGLKNQLDELKAQMQEISDKGRGHKSHAETLQEKVGFLENALQVKEDTCSGQEAELQKLRAHNDSLRSELNSTKSQLDRKAGEVDGLRVEIQQQSEAHSRVIEGLKQQREADQANAEANIAAHKGEISRLQNSLGSLKQTSAQESASRRKQIRALEKELDALRKDNTAKFQELAKARENRDKLMEVLGDFGKTMQEKVITRSPPKTSRKPVSGAPPSNQEQHGWRDDDVQLLVTDSFGSSGSTASGPTPKRPKSSRGIQTPSFEQWTSVASGNTGGTTTRRRTKNSHSAATATERRRPPPLSEAKGNNNNNSPTKQGRKKSFLRSSDTQETVSFATQPEASMGDEIGDFTADYLDEDIFLSPGTV